MRNLGFASALLLLLGASPGAGPLTLVAEQSPLGTFFVWEKVSPCLDSRQDWFSVASSYPGEVGSAARWQKTSFPGGSFAAAAADADKRKVGAGFDNRCCRAWAVLRNTTTGALAVQRTASAASIPSGFVVQESGLCCAEAMNRAGMPLGTQDCRNVRLANGQITQVHSSGPLPVGKVLFAGTLNSVWGNGHVEPPWTRAAVVIELTADGRYLVEPAIPCRPVSGAPGDRPVPGGLGGFPPIQATVASKSPLTLQVTCQSPQRTIRHIIVKIDGDTLTYEETESNGGRASFKGTRAR